MRVANFIISKNVSLFVALSLIASCANYAIYPLLSRLLPSSQYINITVSLSLLTQITTFLSSIIAVTIGLSKSENTNSSNEKITLLQSALFKLFFAVAVVFIISSPLIMTRIHTPVLFALPIALMMLLAIPIAIVSGYLNGKNLMVKLGVLTVISAGTQFTLGIITALLIKNGFVVMLVMSLAQIITILVIYRLFSSDGLPNIFATITNKPTINQRKLMKDLVLYTVLVSLAIMAINLVQIADLLMVQSLHGQKVKFYTDIYVISRVVFFAGTIFIWPFLGEINTEKTHTNHRPFLKVMCYFILITFAAVVGLFFLGNFITQLLFGSRYQLHDIRVIGALSILYKFFFLVITAIVLYFVVLRSYAALWLSLAATILVLGYAQLMKGNSDLYSLLLSLNIIAGSIASLGTVLLLRPQIKESLSR